MCSKESLLTVRKHRIRSLNTLPSWFSLIRSASHKWSTLSTRKQWKMQCHWSRKPWSQNKSRRLPWYLSLPCCQMKRTKIKTLRVKSSKHDRARSSTWSISKEGSMQFQWLLKTLIWFKATWDAGSHNFLSRIPSNRTFSTTTFTKSKPSKRINKKRFKFPTKMLRY